MRNSLFSFRLFKSITQNTQAVNKIIGIIHLVAQAEKSNALSFQVQCLQFRNQLIPIGGQLSVKPGGYSDNQIVIGLEIIAPSLFGRNNIHILRTQCLTYLLRYL